MRSFWVGGLALLVGCSGTDQGDPVRADLGTAGPEILRFAASSEAVEEGLSVVLAWETTGADTVTLEADALDPLLTDSGRLTSTIESPELLTQTTFTLTARGEGDEVSASLTVDVEVPDAALPPRIARFRVTPEIYQGRTVAARVSWTAAGALSLRANGEPVAGFESAPFGALEVEVDESLTEFELQAQRAGQVLTATATVERAPEELEPNDDPSTAAVPSQGRGIGELTSDDQDYWVVEVPDNGRIFAEVQGLFQSCPFDSNLALFSYDEDSGQTVFLTQNDDISAERLCSRIDPSLDPAARGLAAGLYLLLVTGRGADETGDYELLIEIEEGRCGNGDIEFGRGEACDDGNEADGDGCSATCVIEPVLALSDRADQSTTIELDEGVEAIAEVSLSEVGAIAVELEDGCQDVSVELLDAERLDVNDYLTLAAGSCGFQTRAVPPGRYLIRLTGPAGGSGPLALRVRSAPRGCGNLLIEPGELCDDGNIQDGDGCDARCLPEREAIIPGSETRSVTLPASGYQSWAIRLIDGGSVRARPQIASCTGPSRVTLFDRGQVLGVKEAESGCAEIRPAEGDAFAADLEPGVYDLAFQSLNGSAQPADYGLQSLGPACNNGILDRQAGEECELGEPKCQNCFYVLETAGEQGLQTGDEIEYYRFTSDGLPNGRISASLAFQDPQPALNPQLLLELFDPELELLSRSPLDNNPPRTPFSGFVALRDSVSPPGQYTVRLSRPNQAGPVLEPYTVNVNVAAASCGNGLVEPGEVCDDGNTVDRDGCSAECGFEAPTIREVEELFVPESRNDELTRAQFLDIEPGVALVPINGQLVPVGDVDHYLFRVPEGVTVDLRAFSNGNPTAERVCSPDARGRLSLFDGGRNLILSKGDGTDCPDINGIEAVDFAARRLVDGFYYLRFDRPQGGQSTSYALFLILQ
ncbi:MAG: DUF4215 domain-containing protein [Myxococcota bacterium]